MRRAARGPNLDGIEQQRYEGLAYVEADGAEPRWRVEGPCTDFGRSFEAEHLVVDCVRDEDSPLQGFEDFDPLNADEVVEWGRVGDNDHAAFAEPAMRWEWSLSEA